jgi:hypothetical protein
MMSWDIPPLQWFKEAALQAHYFGLGFIQIKVSESERWHFYTDALPGVVGEEEVHNHRYPFISQVMSGELRSDIWLEERGNTHELYNVSCKPGETQELVRQCSIRHAMQVGLTRGGSYWLDLNTFHQVSSNHAITRLTRATSEHRTRAQVIRLLGRPAVCPFSSSLSVEELWPVVERSLRVASRSSYRVS